MQDCGGDGWYYYYSEFEDGSYFSPFLTMKKIDYFYYFIILAVIFNVHCFWINLEKFSLCFSRKRRLDYIVKNVGNTIRFAVKIQQFGILFDCKYPRIYLLTSHWRHSPVELNKLVWRHVSSSLRSERHLRAKWRPKSKMVMPKRSGNVKFM